MNYHTCIVYLKGIILTIWYSLGTISYFSDVLSSYSWDLQ